MANIEEERRTNEALRMLAIFNGDVSHALHDAMLPGSAVSPEALDLLRRAHRIQKQRAESQTV